MPPGITILDAHRRIAELKAQCLAAEVLVRVWESYGFLPHEPHVRAKWEAARASCIAAGVKLGEPIGRLEDA